MGSHKMCVATMSKQRVYVTPYSEVTTDVIVIKCVSAKSKQKSYLKPRELMTKVMVIKCVFLKYQNKELLTPYVTTKVLVKKCVFLQCENKEVPILNHLLDYFFLDCWVEFNIEQV